MLMLWGLATAWLCSVAAVGTGLSDDNCGQAACTAAQAETAEPSGQGGEAAAAAAENQDDEIAMLARLRVHHFSNRSDASRLSPGQGLGSAVPPVEAPWPGIKGLPPIKEGAVIGNWDSIPPPKGLPEVPASHGDSYARFAIDQSDFRKYASGHHRRPTDPPTKTEIVLVQQFLFGNGPVGSLAGADTLFETEQWQSLQRTLAAAGIGGIHPATIQGILGDEVQCPDMKNKPTYKEVVDKKGVEKAFKQLQQKEAMRCNSSNLWHVREVGVEVPDRQHILDVEAAIEAGRGDYDMKRILSVKLRGGYHGKTHHHDGDHTDWGSEVLIAVDVARLDALRVVPEYLEVYEYALDYGIKPPGTVPLDDTSTAYLQTAMSALYLEYESMATTMGLPANFLPKYNGNSGDFTGKPLTYIMKFAQPFAHSRGRKAYTYGQDAKEWLMSAELTKLGPETVPIDGHSISSGVVIGQMPLTFLYVVNHEGHYVNPEQTLPSFDGSPAKSAAMTWYGRGLSFNKTGGYNLLAASAAHMGFDVEGTPLAPFKKERNAAMYAEVVEILASAIADAWGKDEAIPGTGFRPGALARARKHGQSVRVPADAVKHSFDVPAFVNHATPPAFSTEDSPFLPPGATRDARDNAPYMAPPLDADGKPQYAANGPPPPHAEKSSEPSAEAYVVDGYAVTYDVGLKWKMLLSFDRDAGLTFWNVRMQTPASAESPNGTEYPLLFRANVPNFGTDYSASSLGNVQAFNFLESHYSHATAHLKGVSCKGATLPVFLHKGGGGPYLRNKFGVQYTSYSTLGVPGFVDPFLGLPLQGFPSFETGMAKDAIIEDAFCVEEHTMGVNNWHMYAIQTERCLTISQTTISDAYNVIVKGEFCNTGQHFIGQDLQGKPAPGGPAGLDGVGGAYASRGKGGYAPNHMHWGVVALEGFVGGGDNILEVVDSEEEGDSDIYGLAFNFLTKQIKKATDKQKLSYNYELGRAYRIAGVDESGKEVGGLKVESHCWGSKIKESKQSNRAGIPPERSYYGNHWWLRGQDVFVLPVDQSRRQRDTMALLANGRVGEHYDFHRSTAHPQAKTSKFGESFVMFSVLKMRHNVQAEELPIQAAFKHHGMNLKPHFLNGFNPDILMRYKPAWNQFFETNFVGTGGKEYVEALPYTSEFADA